MTALPVDFRACRERGCGNGPDSGAVWTSDTRPARHRLRARRRLPRGPRRHGPPAPPRLLRGARRQPLPPVLALLRGLDQPPRPARKGRLARGRLGGLPGADRAGRSRRPGHLSSRLQLRRRRRELALGRRASSTARRGGRPPVACTSRAAATRATSTRTASRLREPAGPRPTGSR